MVQKYVFLSAIIFLIIGMMHVMRLIFDWKVLVNDRLVPYWMSFPGAVFFMALFACGIYLTRRLPNQG